jgi:hypothetical protein
LAADPAARAELSRAATERAAGWPDADQLADRLDELYRRLVLT